MNCKPIQHRILTLTRPSHLPTALREHLAACPSCTQWYQNFLKVEAAIPTLPVRPTDGKAKAALIARFTVPVAKPAPKPQAPAAKSEATPSVTEPLAPQKPMPLPASRPEPTRATPAAKPSKLTPKVEPVSVRLSWGEWAAKLWPAGLIAATLALGTIAWYSTRGTRPETGPELPPDPMLADVVKINVQIAQSKDAKQRLEALNQLGAQIHQQMQEIALVDASGENLASLQEMYRKVILQGVIQQARLVSAPTPAEKQAILKAVAQQLNDTAQLAEKRSKDVPEVSVRVFREVASIARQGTSRINELMRAI